MKKWVVEQFNGEECPCIEADSFEITKDGVIFFRLAEPYAYFSSVFSIRPFVENKDG